MLKKHYPKAMRFLAKSVRENKKEIIFLSFLGVLVAVANGVIPYLIGTFFDALLNPGARFTIFNVSLPLFVLLLSAWLVAQLINMGLSWVINAKTNRWGTQIAVDYITEGTNRLQRLPMKFHGERKSGALGNFINRASNGIETIVSHIIPNLAPEFLSVFIGLIIALFVNWALALVLVFGLMVYLAIFPALISPVAKIQKKQREAYSSLYTHLYEVLGNIKEVKQAGAEEHEFEKITQKGKKSSKIWKSLFSIWEKIAVARNFIVVIVQLVIFIASIVLIGRGELTIGGLIMFNAYAGMFYGPFMRLGYNWQNLENGLGDLEKAEALLEKAPERYHFDNSISSGEIQGSVDFENVFFLYGKKQSEVLSGINFSAKPGQSIALVGESGAGKSTLIELMSAYYAPTRGRILIDGKNIKKYDLEFLRKQIAVVSQEVVLFNDTIENNIIYGSFDLDRKKMIEAAKKSHAHDFIEKFPKKYKQIVGERGIKLSVGQKQRVAIARAMLRDPKILILDEPTSALDAKSEKFIQESLKELMKGRTTFIIAHRLSTVRKADKILVIEGGKIVEQGKHEELIQKEDGHYKHLYELQIGLHG